MKNEEKVFETDGWWKSHFFYHRTNKSGFGDCYLTNATPHSSFFSVLLIQHIKFVEQHLILLFVPCCCCSLHLLLSMSSFFRLLIVSTTLWSVSFVSFCFCCLPYCGTFSIFFFGHIFHFRWSPCADVMEFQNNVDADIDLDWKIFFNVVDSTSCPGSVKFNLYYKFLFVTWI